MCDLFISHDTFPVHHVCSAYFLADSYLKYVGWTLYDKASCCSIPYTHTIILTLNLLLSLLATTCIVPPPSSNPPPSSPSQVGEVRLASLQLLESLYNSEDTAPHLELFTEKFKVCTVEIAWAVIGQLLYCCTALLETGCYQFQFFPQERLLSMRLDREDSVAVHALHVCGHLLSLDMLEPEDCVQVCELVFVENRAISHAAGDFAVRYLFSEDFMARAKQAKVPKGEYMRGCGCGYCCLITPGMSCGRSQETDRQSDHAARAGEVLS